MFQWLESLSWHADDPEGWAVLSEALLVAFASCDDASQLLTVMGCGGIADLSYLEGGYEPMHVQAILARADAWSNAGDRAIGIGMAVRATAFDPGASLVSDTVARGDKEHLFDVLDGHADHFRECLATGVAPIRAAAAHALSRCRGADMGDAERMLAHIDDETDHEALASRLLFAAVVANRCAESLPQQAFVARLEHPSVLVRCCAAAAVAYARPIGSNETEALAKAIAADAPLPAGWGWRWHHRTETTQAIAVRVLGWADCRTPAAAVKALCQLDGETMHESDALFRLAFPPAETPKLGIAIEELSDVQHAALRAFAKPGFGGRRDLLKRLGLHLPRDVASLLAGAGVWWTARDVTTCEGPRRWHMVRIWREHIAGTVERQAAVDALVEGSPPAELVEAICSGRHGPLLAAHASDAALAERDQLLSYAVLQSLTDKGFDLAEQCRAMLASTERWHTTAWATTLLVAFGDPVGSKYYFG